MGMPENWQSLPITEPIVVDGQVIGNDPTGENVAIHSVVTIPEFQGRGIGKAMLKAYIEYIRGSGIGVRSVVLIAHDYLVGFYEQGGFENRGISECRFAGDVWMDLVSLFDMLYWMSANSLKGLRSLNEKILPWDLSTINYR
jgi:GNAT superfamily N-acetyltransferase